MNDLPASTDLRPRRRRWVRRVAIIAAAALVAAMGASYLLIRLRVWKAPYPPWGKQLCRLIGCPEEAYNFDVVLPGRIYRSSRPDDWLFRYVYRRYGVRHVIMLNADDAYRLAAPPPELGMTRSLFRWSAEVPPPPEQLRQVLELMDSNQPVLVHCWAGADRTGYAVAAHRILREGWSCPQAFQEMNRYWHDPDHKGQLQENLREIQRWGLDGNRPVTRPAE